MTGRGDEHIGRRGKCATCKGIEERAPTVAVVAFGDGGRRSGFCRYWRCLVTVTAGDLPAFPSFTFSYAHNPGPIRLSLRQMNDPDQAEAVSQGARWSATTSIG
jgi:hypothetical protein